MAQMMGVTYPEVVKAAIVSALLYYLALLLMVDFEAAKTGMKGLPKESLPKIKQVMKDGWHFLIPFAVMLYFLLYLRYEAQFAALYAIISMIIMVFIRRPSLSIIKQTANALIEGAQSAIAVTVPCACMEMMFTGKTIDAREALRIGLVSHVVSQEDLMPQSLELAQTICERAPLAVRAVKEAVMRGIHMPLEDALRYEADLRDYLRHTDDAKEGPRAFAEKRPAQFKGQ